MSGGQPHFLYATGVDRNVNCQFQMYSDHKVPRNYSTFKHRLLDYEEERISSVGGVSKIQLRNQRISAVGKAFALQELGRFLQDSKWPLCPPEMIPVCISWRNH